MENTDQDMRDYYSQRAPQYEKVYDYPERQKDLRFLEKFIPQQFRNRCVLEIAAGTGYWSQFIVRQAKYLLATDTEAETLAQLNLAQLNLAQSGRRNDTVKIETRIADAYRLTNINEKFDALFAGHWFSHIPVDQREAFIKTIHSKLLPGATVIFLDNSAAQLNRLPLSGTDGAGNTFQNRTLDDGSTHQILKNFPKASELEALVKLSSTNMIFKEMDHFWLFQYRYESSE
ncbi:MAG: class I SAM-dependent methyltransferase [Pseudomonadales bacterium]|nr:class I SAM-dependent methyltransferase [Pseudomonadales bacterium]